MKAVISKGYSVLSFNWVPEYSFRFQNARNLAAVKFLGVESFDRYKVAFFCALFASLSLACYKIITRYVIKLAKLGIMHIACPTATA
ncbi:MAG: hypothetical protein MRZ54_03835 [Clostridiales bacterium]|nr:hypothetical protein [Clostridiales bacterium]